MVAALVGVLIVGASATGGVLLGAVGVTVGLALFAMLVRPVLAGPILVAVVPAVSGLARGVPVPGLRISELVLVAVSGVALLVGPRSSSARWRSLDSALLAYATANFAMGAIGIVRHHGDADIDSLSALIGPFQYVLLLRAATVSLAASGMRGTAVRWFLLGSIPVSLLAIAQYFHVGGVDSILQKFTSGKFAFYGGFMEPRATGPFEHWHLLAGYLVVVVLLGVELALRHASLLSPVTSAAVIILGTCAMLLTLTFTTFIIGLVGVLVLAARHHQVGRVVTRSLVVLVPAVLAFAPYLAGRLSEQFSASSTNGSPLPQTLGYRFEVWSDDYLPALRGRILLGYGPELPPDVVWRFTESAYIELLLRGGVVLLFAFATFMVVSVMTAASASRSSDLAVASSATIVGLVAVLLIPMHAVFPYFLTTGLPHAYIALAAVMLSGIPLQLADSGERT